MPYRTALTREFVQSRSAPNDAGCWIWSLAVDPEGYGILGPNPNGQRFAHRLSYTLFVGEIPDDLSVDHICFQPDCVNPLHLQLLTVSENSRRKQSDEARERRRERDVARPPSQMSQAVCGRGHVKAESMRRSPNGRLVCRACDIERGRERRAAAKNLPRSA